MLNGLMTKNLFSFQGSTQPSIQNSYFEIDKINKQKIGNETEGAKV
jgi:hypothetical protein